jgi:tetratricopeptide (TPR) repeat protein
VVSSFQETKIPRVVGFFYGNYHYYCYRLFCWKMRKFITFLFVACAWNLNAFAQTRAPLVVESAYMDYVRATKAGDAPDKKPEKPVKKDTKKNKLIAVSALDAVQIAGNYVALGDYDRANAILTQMPRTKNLPVEIERWYLLAQMEQNKGNVDEAIKIYRKILDDQPDLAKIRYELALCYMAKKQWYRADYHLRLAMAGKNIPDNVKQRMMYLRYVARKNKRWNAWFNFGAAPDNNVNQASGGEETIINDWGEFTRVLPNPERAFGYNFVLGGNYELRIGEHWRWKNEANIYSNIYNKHRFDDLYASVATGPRYIWSRGDVWLAAVGARRWYGWDRYNWSLGGKIDSHYDLTRKLSTGLTLRVLNNKYDEYGEYMNGQTYTVSPHITYSFDASKYVVLFGGVDRDTARDDIYANWRYNIALGFGAEIPWGFSIYFEPYFSWVNYDGPRWAVRDNTFVAVTERSFLQRYAVSLSNNKIDIWGFVPTLTLSYTRRDSNIHSREYDKWTAEFTMRQRF